MLVALFDECTGEPTARAALVTAAAGVGKSRLRHELLARFAARGEPVEIWSARGDPMGSLAAFGLAGQLLRQAAQLHDDEPLAARRQKLAARVGRFVGEADRARVAEFLGELVGTPFPAEHRVQLAAARQDPMLMGDQMRRAWVDFVDAESKLTPLLLVLEDLHWGDAPSIELVDTALRVLEDRPLLVLALARPEVHDAFPKLWVDRGVEEVPLGPLPPPASEQLIRDVLGDLAPDVVARIRERSAGNAFFLEEILRATAEGRGDDLPETVLAMALSRLESLAGDERRILRAASVFGDAFWRGGLARLLGVAPPAALDDVLAGLERREWIVRHPNATFRDEHQYAFRHALHREAAYGMLTAADRTLGHQLAGAWLEAAGETNATVLATHFERGGEAGRAARFYQRAAEQGLEGNDLAGALDRVDRAIGCGATGEALGELSLTRAVAHNWRGEPAEAERWAGDGHRGAAARRRALVRRDRERGVGGGDARGHRPCPGDRRGDARCRWRPGGRRRGRPPGGCPGERGRVAPLLRSAHGGRGARRGPRGPGPAPPRRSRGALRDLRVAGVAGASRRRPRRPAPRAGARRRLRRPGRRRAPRLPRPGQRRLRLHGARRVRRGGRDRAPRGGRREAHGAPHGRGLRAEQPGRGALSARRSRARRAPCSRRRWPETGAQDDVRITGSCRAYLAGISLRGGDLDGAEAEARRAVDLLAGTKPLAPGARATLAAVLLARGRPAEAWQEARRAHGDLEAQGQIEEGEAAVRLVYAEALAATGDQAAAAVGHRRGARSASGAGGQDRRCERAPELPGERRRERPHAGARLRLDRHGVDGRLTHHRALAGPARGGYRAP